jgi:hypothetical protein
MENKLITLRDLANRFKRFGLSMAWLKAEAKAGRIPCFKAGRKLLFDPEAVEKALLERARRSETNGVTEFFSKMYNMFPIALLNFCSAVLRFIIFIGS